MAIKAFVFDLDGVITDTALLHYKAWCYELRKLGIDYSEEENGTLKGLPRVTTLKEILRLKKRLKGFSDRDLITIANAKNDFYKQLLQTELSQKSILPGIRELLEKARANGLKLAIASSSHNAPLILKKLKIFKMFDYIVDPSTLENGKPAPDIFIAACQGVDVNTSEVLGFEDAIEGVKGLLAAQIKTVAITWGVKADWKGVRVELENTSQLDFDKLIKL